MKLPSVNRSKKKAVCGYLPAVLKRLIWTNDGLIYMVPQIDEKPSIPS